MSLTLKNPIPASTWTTIRAYFTNLFIPLFNTANTASGTSSATLDAKSGTVKFSATCLPGSTLDLIIANTYISATTPMFFNLNYETANMGEPSILYTQKGTGSVVIRVKNQSISDTTNGDISIDFQIMN